MLYFIAEFLKDCFVIYECNHIYKERKYHEK